MINATFSMMGKNPPSILIVGGILFLLLGGISIRSAYLNSEFFVQTGSVLLVFGIFIQILWLWSKNR